MIGLRNVKNWQFDTGIAARFMVVLGGVMVALSLMTSPWQSSAQGVSGAATISVPVPQAVKGASQVTLDVALRAPRQSAGNVGGVVRIKRAGAAPVEVGRFSLYAEKTGEQRFRFDAMGAVRQLDLSGGSVDVEVALIDRSSGRAVSGGSLSIASAQFATR